VKSERKQWDGIVNIYIFMQTICLTSKGDLYSFNPNFDNPQK